MNNGEMRVCAVCGISIEHRVARARFCSRKCSFSKWKVDNKETVASKHNFYYQLYRDKILARARSYHASNRSKRKQYKADNLQRDRERQRLYRESNKDVHLERLRLYRITKADALKSKRKAYHQKIVIEAASYRKILRDPTKLLEALGIYPEETQS